MPSIIVWQHRQNNETSRDILLIWRLPACFCCCCVPRRESRGVPKNAGLKFVPLMVCYEAGSGRAAFKILRGPGRVPYTSPGSIDAPVRQVLIAPHEVFNEIRIGIGRSKLNSKSVINFPTPLKMSNLLIAKYIYTCRPYPLFELSERDVGLKQPNVMATP